MEKWFHGFSHAGKTSKVLPLQPIAAHSYIAIWIKGNNSSKILPLQPLAARSCLAILITGGGGG